MSLVTAETGYGVKAPSKAEHAERMADTGTSLFAGGGLSGSFFEATDPKAFSAATWSSPDQSGQTLMSRVCPNSNFENTTNISKMEVSGAAGSITNGNLAVANLNGAKADVAATMGQLEKSYASIRNVATDTLDQVCKDTDQDPAVASGMVNQGSSDFMNFAKAGVAAGATVVGAAVPVYAAAIMGEIKAEVKKNPTIPKTELLSMVSDRMNEKASAQKQSPEGDLDGETKEVAAFSLESLKDDGVKWDKITPDDVQFLLDNPDPSNTREGRDLLDMQDGIADIEKQHGMIRNGQVLAVAENAAAGVESENSHALENQTLEMKSLASGGEYDSVDVQLTGGSVTGMTGLQGLVVSDENMSDVNTQQVAKDMAKADTSLDSEFVHKMAHDNVTAQMAV